MGSDVGVEVVGCWGWYSAVGRVGLGLMRGGDGVVGEVGRAVGWTGGAEIGCDGGEGRVGFGLAVMCRVVGVADGGGRRRTSGVVW